MNLQDLENLQMVPKSQSVSNKIKASPKNVQKTLGESMQKRKLKIVKTSFWLNVYGFYI